MQVFAAHYVALKYIHFAHNQPMQWYQIQSILQEPIVPIKQFTEAFKSNEQALHLDDVYDDQAQQVALVILLVTHFGWSTLVVLDDGEVQELNWCQQFIQVFW